MITILCADDNSMIMMNFSFMKLKCQTKRDFAKNGKEALEKYNKLLDEGFIYNFILMDVDMPILNGLEATAEIRKKEAE